MKLTVIDAIPGLGKTTSIMEHMDDHANERWCFAATRLEEAKRIADGVLNLKFVQPQAGYDVTGIVAKRKGGIRAKTVGVTKSADILKHFAAGSNISTTHQLLDHFTAKTVEAYKGKDYNLVIDETINNMVEAFDDKQLEPDDLTRMIKLGGMYLDTDGMTVRWRDPDDTRLCNRGVFKEVRKLCDEGKLIWDERTKAFYKVFPIDILRHFKQIYILTYMFKYSPMARYLASRGIEVNNVRGIDPEQEGAHIAELDKLITIEEGKLNDIGKKYYALSFTDQKRWLKKVNGKEHPDLTTVKKNLNNFYKNRVKPYPYANKAQHIMWTCSKALLEKVKTRYCSSQKFLEYNARALNRLKDKTSLAYILNVFCHGSIKNYLGYDKESEEQYALSMLIQFLWRSALREREPVVMYIPSSRMRRLLKTWLRRDLTGEQSGDEQQAVDDVA
jgi:hypothetical protein